MFNKFLLVTFASVLMLSACVTTNYYTVDMLPTLRFRSKTHASVSAYNGNNSPFFKLHFIVSNPTNGRIHKKIVCTERNYNKNSFSKRVIIKARSDAGVTVYVSVDFEVANFDCSLVDDTKAGSE